jgi:hypothetical protein
MVTDLLVGRVKAAVDNLATKNGNGLDATPGWGVLGNKRCGSRKLRGSRLRNLTTPSPFAPRPMMRASHSAHPRCSHPSPTLTAFPIAGPGLDRGAAAVATTARTTDGGEVDDPPRRPSTGGVRPSPPPRHPRHATSRKHHTVRRGEAAVA